VAPQDDANMMPAAKMTDWQGNGGKGMNERIQTGFWHQPIKLELKKEHSLAPIPLPIKPHLAPTS
jgi:hypothetical protein